MAQYFSWVFQQFYQVRYSICAPHGLPHDPMLYLQPHQVGATTVQLKPTTFAPHLGLSIQHDLLFL